MVILKTPVGHGPHLWYCKYYFIADEVYLDFFGDDKSITKAQSLFDFLEDIII